MNYEKAYKEALERARKLATDLPNGRADRLYHVSDLETIFPELKESEDEKIRKALLDYFGECKKLDINPVHDAQTNTILAWLEKQGEQKPAWSEECSIACCEMADWADQHPRKGLWDAEKVIKWLQDNADSYTWYNEFEGESGMTDDFIEDLRKAMED